MPPIPKNITLSQKTFIALITALVGTGGYATIGNPLNCLPNNEELAHKVEMRDTAQAWQNRYMLDSISRVGRKVEQVDAKLDTLMDRQERYLAAMLGAVQRNEAVRISARRKAPASLYSMRAP